MLNNIGRLLIALGVIGFIAPLAMTLIMMVKATSAINSAFKSPDEERQIASGLSGFEINWRTRQLKNLLAPRSVVAGAASSVTIAAVTFDRHNAERVQKAQELAAGENSTSAVNAALSAPHPLTVDYGDATRRAVVLISADSLAIDVAATNPANAMGVLGLELKTFADVSKLKPGMLAGYKVEAATGTETVVPDDPEVVNAESKRKICDAVKSWTRHFGLRAAQAEFVLFRDPATLSFDGSKWVSDGSVATRLFDTDMDAICRR